MRLSRVTSAKFALPVNRLRYVTHGAGSAQGAASRRRPLYPRAPASNIATAWCLRLIPAGFGSGRGSVRAKHGPQPASMRAAPAFRERLSDVEAASTGSFSGPMSGGDSHTGSGPRRPDKASAATRQNNGATGLPGRSSMIARRRCACAGLLYLRLQAAFVGRVSVAPPGKITAQQGCLEGHQRLPGSAALARAWGVSLREDPVGRGMR